MRFTLVAFLLGAGIVGAQSPYPVPQFSDPSRVSRLTDAARGAAAQLDEARTTLHAPGLSWGVVVDGAVVAAGGSGVAQIGDTTPVNEDTVFRIASMTKSFTALAILALRDEGKLSLDEPAGKYVPELATMPLPTRDAPAITIRHLLTHSAGFPEDNPWGDRQLAQPPETLTSWVRAGLPFSTSPGTAYEYSNYGFALLGQIVARASGMPYRDFVSTRILRPLGMSSTYWEPGRCAIRPARARVSMERHVVGRGDPACRWRLRRDGRTADLGPRPRAIHRVHALGVAAARRRGQRAGEAQLRAGDAAGAAALELHGDACVADRTDDRLDARLRVWPCVRLGLLGYRFLVSHGGGLPGFGSNMTWLPEYGVGVYVMANVTYAGPAAAARAVLDRLNATGALQPRMLHASPALLGVRERAVSLVNGWKDETLTEVAADNLLLDKSLATRRDELTALHERLGACRIAGDIDAENWLRGRFRLACERGALDATVTLAPTNPPRVQYLLFNEGQGTSLPPPSAPCDPVSSEPLIIPRVPAPVDELVVEAVRGAAAARRRVRAPRACAKRAGHRAGARSLPSPDEGQAAGVDEPHAFPGHRRDLDATPARGACSRSRGVKARRRTPAGDAR